MPVNTRVKIHQYARGKLHQCKADGWVDSGFWQGEREGDYPPRRIIEDLIW
jgi:hypothetical protein